MSSANGTGIVRASGPAVAVRPAAAEDAPAIARVFGVAFDDYRRGFGIDATTLAGLWADSLVARVPATTVAVLNAGPAGPDPSRPLTAQVPTVVGFVVTVRPGATEEYGTARDRQGRMGQLVQVLGLRGLWRLPAFFAPIGMAYARRSQAKDELYISLLAVDPAYQGRGIGQALLGAAEAEARAAGAAGILLHTAANNVRARKAYTRAGYEVVCTVRASWAGPARIPAYVALRKPLRPDPAPRIAALGLT
jgi:ribosomal protein S18 acetylase RimI-like enzyme